MGAERLNEILQRLNIQHGSGQEMTPEEYEQQRCNWANDNKGDLNEYDGYNCDICKNKGVVYFLQENPYSKQKVMTLKPCKCSSIRATLRRAKKSGLNNILTDYTFDKYEVTTEWQRVVKEKAQAFCKDDQAHWFYIGGQTGAGKTHICTAIAAHYIKSGLDCRYMLWRDDAVKLKAVVNDFAKYQELIEPFKSVDVLYIDDYLKVQDGTEPTTADINLAFELLNYRLLDKDKITIISSEFTMPRALELDEATNGRIYQKAGNYKINIDRDFNKNYRLKNNV